MRALALRVSAGVVIACLFACGLQATASAQGRGQGKGRGSNPNAGGSNPGAGQPGRGRSGDVDNGQGRSDNAGADARRGGAGGQGRDDSAAGDDGQGRGGNRGGEQPGADDADAEDSNGSHGQEVSARRRAAIEAWKASWQSGPPPWAGVGGG